MTATADDTPLRPIVEAWSSMIGHARDHRAKQFGENAEFFHRLYTEKHDFLYEKEFKGRAAGKEIAEPAWKMTFNKVAELVQLFGPQLYHRNPHRHVLPRKVDLPEELFLLQYGMQAQAVLGQRAMTEAVDKVTAGVLSVPLNYLPGEFDLKRESMQAIDEALVAGRGVLWTEMHAPDTDPGRWLPRTYFKSWRHLYLDPDADCVKDATWCALECTAPYFEVEKEYRLPPGSLKKHAKGETATRAAGLDANPKGATCRAQGVSHDQIRYYKVWSKKGMGHRLIAPAATVGGLTLADEAIQAEMERFGDYCFLVIAEGVPYPLNVPPDVQNAPIEPDPADPESEMAAAANLEDLMSRVRWPIPFYLEEGGWPFTEIDFHPVSGQLWPMAHLQPAVGELMFLDWAFSWLAGRMELSGRNLIFTASQLADNVEAALRRGGDFQVERLDGITRNIKEFVEVFTFPEVNKDVWAIIDRVMLEFEKRTGLSDLVYGMAGKQMRSASEAQMREQAVSTRPDDMADKVEDWQSRVARKEALALRRMVPPQAVAPIFREQFDPTGMMIGPATRWWATAIYRPLDENDPMSGSEVEAEFEYTIEAGSVRKPNVERDQANAELAAQTYLPVFQGYFQMTGDPTPFNGFTAYWAKAHQIDPAPLLLPALPPPPMAPPVGPDGQPVEDPNAVPQPAGVM